MTQSASFFSLLKIFSKELLTSVYIPCTQDFALEIVIENLPVRISEEEIFFADFWLERYIGNPVVKLVKIFEKYLIV